MPVSANRLTGMLTRHLPAHLARSAAQFPVMPNRNLTSLSGTACNTQTTLSLCGKTGADRLVGASLLHGLLRRTFSGLTSARFERMMEPYGTVLRSMQADFLKIGFFKIHEDEYAMLFSDGTSKVELAVTDRHYHPSLAALYANKKGAYHRLAILADKMNSPEIKKQEFEDRNAVMEKYGLNSSDTPKTMLDHGYTASLRLSMQQLITFLATHKAALQALEPDDESAQSAALAPKASEKIDYEQRIYRKLWVTRHDRHAKPSAPER